MRSGKPSWRIKRLVGWLALAFGAVWWFAALSGCAAAPVEPPAPTPIARNPSDAPSATPLAAQTGPPVPTASPSGAPASKSTGDTPVVPTAPFPSAAPTAAVPPAVHPASPTPGPVPAFSHIGVLVLENHEFGRVIGNDEMPTFNAWANQYTLLTQYFAIRHPSLPNYLALIGGSTFSVTTDCTQCYLNAPTLPDLLEAGGRTWKSYQEDLPSPCFSGDTATYFQKHNPFLYFDPIRLDAARCQQGVVNLDELQIDLERHTLPDFFFITPNICNDAHNCDVRTSDLWLGKLVPFILAYPDMQRDGLLVITWDEGQGDHGCCGMDPAGGRVATLLLSPLARRGFQDDTPYTHYSLLKTIAAAWGLPELAHAADPQTALIRLPWQK